LNVAAILLAAGRASRFGGSKLTAPLGGQPVYAHAAAAISQLPLSARFAVVGPETRELAQYGFDCLPLEPADAPMSQSIAIGVTAAVTSGADAVLIALADMPLVPVRHFEALLAGFDGQAIGTSIAGIAMPPAVFGGTMFAALCALEGDSGARRLLENLPGIELAPALGLDIDRPRDLDRAGCILASVSQHI
jgi:molybdenum cofactor cytidylyltransferase